MGLVIGLTELACIPAGFLGFLGDRLGSGKLIISSYFGLCVFSSFMLFPNPTLPALLFIRFGVGFFMDMALVGIQDYCTNLFDFAHQDRVTGALELSYSISMLAIIPLLGVIYEAFGWQAPFLLLASVLYLFLPLLLLIVWRNPTPSSRKQPALDETRPGLITARGMGYLSGVQPRTGALAFNISGLFVSLGGNLLAAEFGILLGALYGLNETESGTANLVLGLGELLGVLGTMSPCISTSSFRSMEISTFCMFLLSLPFILWGDVSLNVTLVLVFLMFICQEFGIVQSFARANQFASQADAIAILGVNVQFHFVGRTVGAALAGVLYQDAGHKVVAIVASASFLLAFVTLYWGIYQKRQWDAQREHEQLGQVHHVHEYEITTI